MSLRRVGRLAATALATLLWISCGDVYRPVVIPTTLTPPNPANFHAVFGVSTNAPSNPGTALQIDVSGDTDIGAANMGVNPTHAAILPNNSRVFVAAAGSLYPGEADFVSAFTPAGGSTTATGLGTPTIFSYPDIGAGPSATITNISEAGNSVTVTLSNALSNAKVGALIDIASVSVAGYNGSFLISSVNGTTIQYADPTPNLPAASGGNATVPVTCSYLPDYVATTQSNAVYVANYGVENDPNCNLASTDSVAMLSTLLNTITNIAYLPPGSHPVAMAETPNALNLYVVNQGNNTVTDLSPIDLSTLTTIAVGNTPVWAVSRVDGNRVYVLTQADGKIVPIDTTTNAILPSQTNLSVGVGTTVIDYDPVLNRLYVPYPGTAASNFMDSAVYVFSTTGGVDPTTGVGNDTPLLLKVIPMATGANPPCPNGCTPVSVSALPDTSRFYVASYQTAPTCPADPIVGASPCIIPMLTVFDALSMTVKTPTSPSLPAGPSLSLLANPPFAMGQFALFPESSCQSPVLPATYSPGSTRFRMFTAAASDSSHVYVSICDAGSIADITTVTDTVAYGTNAPDTLVTDLPAPFAACSGATCGTVASITGFSIATSGGQSVVTFQAPNSFTAGQQVAISGFASNTPGAVLDGLTLTVIATGLSGSQFECNLPTVFANVAFTVDAGIAAASPVAVITAFQITSGVVTFTAANNFVAGQRVVISGLSSSAGTALNGLYLTVLATGLTTAQFECNVSNADVPKTADSGSALPLPPSQSPIFLLVGQ